MWKFIHRLAMAIVASAGIGAVVGCGESQPAATPSAPAAGDVTYKCAGCGKTVTAASTASAPSC
jgi:hypothetical protein